MESSRNTYRGSDQDNRSSSFTKKSTDESVNRFRGKSI